MRVCHRRGVTAGAVDRNQQAQRGLQAAVADRRRTPQQWCFEVGASPAMQTACVLPPPAAARSPASRTPSRSRGSAAGRSTRSPRRAGRRRARPAALGPPRRIARRRRPPPGTPGCGLRGAASAALRGPAAPPGAPCRRPAARGAPAGRPRRGRHTGGSARAASAAASFRRRQRPAPGRRGGAGSAGAGRGGSRGRSCGAGRRAGSGELRQRCAGSPAICAVSHTAQHSASDRGLKPPPHLQQAVARHVCRLADVVQRLHGVLAVLAPSRVQQALLMVGVIPAGKSWERHQFSTCRLEPEDIDSDTAEPVWMTV